MSTIHIILLCTAVAAAIFVVGYLVGSNNPYPAAKRNLISKFQASLDKLKKGVSNPTFTRDDAEKLARSRGCRDKVMLIGFRAATSKYGEYDDTLALLTPNSYTEWKGNTLPSKWEHGVACLQPGDYKWVKGLHGIHHFDDVAKVLGKTVRDNLEKWLNDNVGHDHAELKDKDDNHIILPYWAFRQAGPMMIIRDGLFTNPKPDGWPGDPAWIDGHHGGWNGTSSLACQTWHPGHWVEARAAGYAAMDSFDQKDITYSLHLLN